MGSENHDSSIIYSFPMIAAVTSEVVADPEDDVKTRVYSHFLLDLPPISAVLTLPSLTTPKVALAMLFAMESRLMRGKNLVVRLNQKNGPEMA